MVRGGLSVGKSRAPMGGKDRGLSVGGPRVLKGKEPVVYTPHYIEQPSISRGDVEVGKRRRRGCLMSGCSFVVEGALKGRPGQFLGHVGHMEEGVPHLEVSHWRPLLKGGSHILSRVTERNMREFRKLEGSHDLTMHIEGIDWRSLCEAEVPSRGVPYLGFKEWEFKRGIRPL